jgi:integrase/recombinase XerD
VGVAGLLVHGKGNRERHVFLSGKDAKALLKTYLKRRGQIGSTSDHLLLGADGDVWTPQLLRRRLGALAKRADISRRVTPHMLRHTAATQLIEAGVDIRFVQKLLGHASIATTQIYTQVSDSSLRSTLEKANTLDRVVNGRRR